MTVYLKFTVDETDELLRKYGYCLSKSIAADTVITWFLKTQTKLSGAKLLGEINDVLEQMGSPLLMTRIIER